MDSTHSTRTKRAPKLPAGDKGDSPKPRIEKGTDGGWSGGGAAEAVAEDPGPARERILDAAEAVFAEKGFDGARVHEIARAAGVNKALIYYYFEGKAQLLDALMERIGEENQSVKEQAIAEKGDDEERIEALMAAGFDFLKRRKKFFSILFMELFKTDNQHLDVLRYLDRVFESGAALRARLGLDKIDIDEWRMPGVFFGMAPMLFFLLLEDKWVSFYKADREEFEKKFLAQFTEFYGSLARKLLTDSMKPIDADRQ